MESVSSASAVSLTIKVRGVNCRGKMISMCRSQEGRLLRAQVRKMLALKPENLSSILVTHMVGRGSQLQQAVLQPHWYCVSLHMCKNKTIYKHLMVHTVNTKITSCAPCLSPSPYLSVPYFLPSFGEQHTHMALCLLTGCHTPFLNPHA